jgi:perosamine synthetase
MNDIKENAMPHLKVPLAKPWIGDEEAEAARRVVASGWVIFGPESEAFEKEFAATMNAKYAVAVNSGSSALLVALAAAGVKPGDEVIVPNMTFVSTASAALFLGAVPVFADITLDDYGMDPASVERLITKKTKVIMPVHYAGQTARMKELLELAKKHKLLVIEDSAESHLAKYDGVYSGTLGALGIFSFTPSKPMTTGEGGMIVTNDAELAKKAKLVRNFGDTDKFKWDLLGFNFRMPEVMGAIGRIQLKKLHESVRRRREIGRRYSDAFKNLEGILTPYVRTEEDHNFQLYTLRLDPKVYKINRDAWIRELQNRGVSARLYYPTLHNQPVFSGGPKTEASHVKNSLVYADTALSLPIYPTLKESEQNFVIQCMLDVHKTAKGSL